MLFQLKLQFLLLLVTLANLSFVHNTEREAPHPLNLRLQTSRADRPRIRGLTPREQIRPQACPSPQRADCARFPDPWGPCDVQGGLEGPADFQLRDLASSITSFGAELFRSVAEHNLRVNVALSPVSVAAALTHLLLGSRDKTQKDLEEALRYTGRFPCVHATLRTLLNQTRTLTSASQLFFREGICLEQTFIDRSLRLYGQEPEALTRNASDNVRVINDWVARQTKGLLPKLVSSVPDETVIMILNAVHYVGTWKTKFDKRLTKEEDFWVSHRETVRVPMLQSPSYPMVATYIPSLKIQVGKLQLSGRTSLLLLVPQGPEPGPEPGRSLRELELSLTGKRLRSIARDLQPLDLHPVNLLLPRLHLDFTQELLAPLTEMGLQDALFYPNLCGLTLGRAPSISSVTHRAALSLDERGVEAAAATSMSVGRTISVFEATRPFVWLLWDDELGFPLFMGRVYNPLM